MGYIGRCAFPGPAASLFGEFLLTPLAIKVRQELLPQLLKMSSYFRLAFLESGLLILLVHLGTHHMYCVRQGGFALFVLLAKAERGASPSSLAHASNNIWDTLVLIRILHRVETVE